MGVKVTNNGYGTISAGLASGDTTITLDTGQGARFPTLGAGDYFYATLIDTSNNLEIVKVTARSTDSMTVVRGQDNTTARAFSIGDRFELRPTAALFEDVQLQDGDKGDITVSSNGSVFTIDNGAVTAAKLASTLDLSGKTVTLPTGVGGKVLQQVVKRSTTLASLNTTTYTEASSDYRVSITPVSASSRIYLRYCIPVNPNGSTNVIMHTRAWKFSPSSVAPTSDGGNFNGNLGNRAAASGAFRPYGYDSNDPDTWVFEAYDDPGSTSTQQYGFLYKRETGGTNTVYFAHSAGNTSSYGWMAPVIIIATEIA